MYAFLDLVSSNIVATASQVDISAKHGFITLREDGDIQSTNATNKTPLRVVAAEKQLNRVLLSLEYAPAQDWFGWDVIDVTLTDHGHEGLDANPEPQEYKIYLAVAAINDAPALNVVGLGETQILDQESPLGDDVGDAFLVSSQEDIVTVVTGISVCDVDYEVSGVGYSQLDEFDVTAESLGEGCGSEGPTFQLGMELSVSCTYGLLALNDKQGGLFYEKGGLDARNDSFIVFGTLTDVNDVLSRGIVYTPLDNWSGTDVIKVSEQWREHAVE